MPASRRRLANCGEGPAAERARGQAIASSQAARSGSDGPGRPATPDQACVRSAEGTGAGHQVRSTVGTERGELGSFSPALI